MVDRQVVALHLMRSSDVAQEDNYKDARDGGDRFDATAGASETRVAASTRVRHCA